MPYNISKKILTTFGSSAFPSHPNCVYYSCQSSLDGKESVSSLVLFCLLMIRDCWNATSAFSLEALSSSIKKLQTVDTHQNYHQKVFYSMCLRNHRKQDDGPRE